MALSPSFHKVLQNVTQCLFLFFSFRHFVLLIFMIILIIMKYREEKHWKLIFLFPCKSLKTKQSLNLPLFFFPPNKINYMCIKKNLMSGSKQKKTLEHNSKTKAKLRYSIRITKGFTVSILISSTFQIFFQGILLFHWINATILFAAFFFSFFSLKMVLIYNIPLLKSYYRYFID